jgi:hypothetical protein
VAAKRPLGELAADQRARIEREVEALRDLRHPRLACFEDLAWDAEDRPVLIYEYVEGRSLLGARGTERPATDRILSWLGDVAEGLDFLHEAGVVHRDLKPENVMIDPEGRARVLDFGLAREVGEGGTVTATGLVLGTPGYMAPEVLLGERPGPAADRFALAALGAWLWSGREVFPGRSPGEVVQAILAGRREPTGHATLDRSLGDLLADDPSARPTSCAEVVERIREALIDEGQDRPTVPLSVPAEAVNGGANPAALPAPRRWRLPRIGVALIGLAAIGWALTPPRMAPDLEAPSPPPPRSHPFDDTWFERLGSELELRARDTEPDPRDTVALTGFAPAARKFWDWVGSGNHAEDLPEAVIVRLRRHDAVLRDCTLPALFEPFLPRSEDGLDLVIPAGAWGDYGELVLPKEVLGPSSYSIALRAGLRTDALQRALADSLLSLTTGQVPKDWPPRVSSLWMHAGGGLRVFIESTARKREHRSILFPVLRDTATEVIRTVHFLGRAMRDATTFEQRLRVGHLARANLSRRTALLGGPLCYFDPDAVIGPVGDDPWLLGLRGDVRLLFARGRVLAGLGGLDLADRAARDLDAAVSSLDGSRRVGAEQRRYRLHLLEKRIKALLLANRDTEGLGVYIEHQDWLERARRPGSQSRVLMELVPTFLASDAPEVVAAGRKAAAWLRATADPDSDGEPLAADYRFRDFVARFAPE